MNQDDQAQLHHLKLARQYIQQYEERINQDHGPKDPDYRRMYEERPYHLAIMHAAYAQAEAATRQAEVMEDLLEFASELVGETNLLSAIQQWSARIVAG